MNFNYITSKTHRYISVRIHPSDYILEKFLKREQKALIQFNEYYNSYTDFYKLLYEFITDESYDDFTQRYFFDTMECSHEEIYEQTGILITSANHTLIYCIPKKPELDKIYEYMLENIPCKFKILKRTRGTYFDLGVSTHHRKNSKPFSELKIIK